MGDIDRNKLRFGYSGMRFRIRVSIQGSGTRISGYPLRSLVILYLTIHPAPTGVSFGHWCTKITIDKNISHV